MLLEQGWNLDLFVLRHLISGCIYYLSCWCYNSHSLHLFSAAQNQLMMINLVSVMTAWTGLLLLSLCVVTSEDVEKQIPELVRGTDCTHIKTVAPNAASGIYTIQPLGFKRSFKVYCEMLEDGGWTVIQRRTGGKLSFNKNWKQYKNGFGPLLQDHWLGLSKIWALTKRKSGKSTLRVDLWDFERGSAFAQYENFRIGDEKSAYRLHVERYNGNAGDAIRGANADLNQNGYGFSTPDRDNDGCSPCIFGDIAIDNCSAKEGGGWWYSRCGSASLHGDWRSMPDNRGWTSGLKWLTWKTADFYSAKSTRMMVKTVKQRQIV